MPVLNAAVDVRRCYATRNDTPPLAAVRALLCLSGLETGPFVRHALAALPREDLTAVLLHVVDTRPEHERGYLPRVLLRAPPPAHQRELEAAQAEAGAAAIADARAVCRQLGVAVVERSAHGRPEREIVRIAAEERADLIVVGAHDPNAPAIGPHSVGPVARFVLDHAPCDVLLLRG